VISKVDQHFITLKNKFLDTPMAVLPIGKRCNGFIMRIKHAPKFRHCPGMIHFRLSQPQSVQGGPEKYR